MTDDHPFYAVLEAAGFARRNRPQNATDALDPAPRVKVPENTDSALYAARALDHEVATVAAAPEGVRNDTLNKSAFKIAGYLDQLDRDAVVDRLTDAGHRAGLTDREITKTLRQALPAGAARPRPIPDQNGSTTIEINTRGDTGAEPSDAERGRTWRPVDLAAILRGEHQPPTPGIGLTRTDNLALLYPGKEHTVIGEMESGKSWFCCASIAAELHAGHHVVYVHFEEADPTDTVGRLLTLGVPAHTIAERFHFVAPSEQVRPDYLAALLDPPPSLVVLDGVNEAMSLHGLGVREEDGAAAYRRRLVRPCTDTGAAVLSADHVVKDRERRGREPLGSVHKGNGITGALILLENAEPFGRGRKGCSHVFITKDRPGYLRRHGSPDRKTPGKTHLGSLVVDDDRTGKDYLDLYFTEPAIVDATTPPTFDKEADDDQHVLDVVRKLHASNPSKTPCGRDIRENANIGHSATLSALERLVTEGALTKEHGPGGAHLFYLSESEGDTRTGSGSDDTAPEPE